MTFDMGETLDEVIEFRLSLSKETDRGCALMAGAFLDDQLQRLLRKALVDDKSAVDILFDFSSSLGTFSGRIKMCYALGLIPKDAMRDLDLIRKIRNDFGHDAKPLDFADSKIASRSRELSYVTREGGSTRARFTNAALCVCAILHVATESSKHAEPASSILSKYDTSKLREDVGAIVRSLMTSVQPGESTGANP